MNKWEQHGMEEKVLAILRDVPKYSSGQRLGRPFLTTYQIAIEFAQRYPDTVQALGYPIGGANVGIQYSLSNYLGAEIARYVENGLLPVDGVFLSNLHLNDISFRHRQEVIHSSLTNTQYPLTMFRLSETKA